MSEDKNKEESVIELAKRVGSKEAARIVTEQKSKLKQEKGFEKTGQYYFDLDLGLKQGGLAKWFNHANRKITNTSTNRRKASWSKTI